MVTLLGSFLIFMCLSEHFSEEAAFFSSAKIFRNLVPNLEIFPVFLIAMQFFKSSGRSKSMNKDENNIRQIHRIG